MERAYSIRFKPHKRTSLLVDQIPENIVYAENKDSAKELGQAIVRDYYEKKCGWTDEYMVKQYTYIITREWEDLRG